MSGLPEATMEHIKNAIANPKYKEKSGEAFVELNKLFVGDEQIDFLINQLCKSPIKHKRIILNLLNNKISDEGIRLLLTSSEFRGLEIVELDLRKNNLKESSLQALADFVETNPNLRKIELNPQCYPVCSGKMNQIEEFVSERYEQRNKKESGQDLTKKPFFNLKFSSEWDGLTCGLTGKLMKDPVILDGEGETYEREIIKRYYEEDQKSQLHFISPRGKKLNYFRLTPNLDVKEAIEKYLEKKGCKTVEEARDKRRSRYLSKGLGTFFGLGGATTLASFTARILPSSLSLGAKIGAGIGLGMAGGAVGGVGGAFIGYEIGDRIAENREATVSSLRKKNKEKDKKIEEQNKELDQLRKKEKRSLKGRGLESISLLSSDLSSSRSSIIKTVMPLVKDTLKELKEQKNSDLKEKLKALIEQHPQSQDLAELSVERRRFLVKALAEGIIDYLEELVTNNSCDSEVLRVLNEWCEKNLNDSLTVSNSSSSSSSDSPSSSSTGFSSPLSSSYSHLSSSSSSSSTSVQQEDKKALEKIHEIRELLDEVYSPKDIQYTDTRKAYLLELADYEKQARIYLLNSKDKGSIDNLLEKLQMERTKQTGATYTSIS